VFNNYYNSQASNYCVRAGIEASILLQGNYFDGVDSPHQFNNDSNRETAYIALGEGALANQYSGVSGDREVEGGGDAFEPPYDFDVDPVSDVPDTVRTGAGPH
jgi:pectate lyase